MTEPYKAEIECGGVKVELMFDGFCLTVSTDEKFVFPASVNDPTVSERGNACLLLFSPDEIAGRLENGIKQPEELCLITSGRYGICNLSRGHYGVVHQEILEDGTVWAEWRSIIPSDQHTKAEKYVPPHERELPDDD